MNSEKRSQNYDVLYVYNYLTKNKHVDGDFWDLGGGYKEVQESLNDFDNEDWKELKAGILMLSEFERYILLHSITFDFYDSFKTSFNEETFANAGDYLLEMFYVIKDSHLRDEIAYFSSFINKSKTKPIEKLEFMKNWMLDNGYDTNEWLNSKMNPLGNIEVAIINAITLDKS